MAKSESYVPHIICKICELNIGKPVTKTNTRDLWSQFDLRLSECQTRHLTAMGIKNQEQRL